MFAWALPRRVESSEKKIEEKKEEHSTVSTVILTEPVEWDGRTIPRTPLAVQAHCHPDSRAADFQKAPLASIIWMCAAPLPGLERGEGKRELFHSRPYPLKA